MNTELNMLLASTILGIFQMLTTAAASTSKRGLGWNLSARDQALPPLTGVPGRLDRALQNFKETFPFFIAAVLLVQVTNHQGSMSGLGAQLYFWARLIYLPIYALGIPGLRTLVWAVSIVGIALLLASVV